MARPVSDEIVARLNELGTLLAAWCEQGRDQPLASHETIVLGLVRRVLPRLLEAVEAAATSGLDRRLADDQWTDRVDVVDFYQASEHLAAVAQAAFGDTPDARTWIARNRHALLTAGPDPVRAALATLTAPTPAARALLRRERGYFRQHAERMAYHTFRFDGLPIGPEAIESAATHVVQIRLKRPDMRWSIDGARAVLALRARDRSGRPLAA